LHLFGISNPLRFVVLNVINTNYIYVKNYESEPQRVLGYLTKKVFIDLTVCIETM
jgi:hypothetical protein